MATQITADNQVTVLTASWNNGTTAYTAFKLDVNNVLTPTSSILFDVGTNTGTYVSRFSINVSGSVGIGTTVPSGRLEVVGTSGSLLLVTDNLSGSLFSVNDVTGLPILEVFSDDRVVAGAVNSNALVVTGSSVGIGMSTPTARLFISGSSVTNQPELVVREGVPSPTGGVGILDVQNSSGTSLFFVSGSGLVGVGTSAPNTTLSVYNSSMASMSLWNSSNYTRLSVSGNDFYLDAGQGTAGGGATIFRRGSGTAEHVRFDSSGNVGIGTSGMNGLLNVYKTSGGNVEILSLITTYAADSSTRSLTWRDQTNITGQIDTRYNGTTVDMIFGSLYNGGYNSTERMRLTGAGNIGIGTSSFTGRLYVSGSSTASTPTMVVREGVVSPTGGVGVLNVQNSAGTSLLFVSGSGNVGVGVTNPTNILTINKANGTGLNIQYDNSTNVRTGLFLFTRGSSIGGFSGGSEWTDSTTTARSTAASTMLASAGTLLFYTDSSLTSGNTFTPTERMRIDTSGDVGIGTTTITAKLTLSSSSPASIDIGMNRVYSITNNSTGSINFVSLPSVGTRGTHDYGAIVVKGNSPSGVNDGGSGVFELRVGGASSTSTSDLSVFLRAEAITGASNGPDMVSLFSRSTRGLVVSGSSGYVGIGTSNVRSQTHIYGTSQATAAITDAGSRGAMLRLSDSDTSLGAGGAILFANFQGDLVNSSGYAAIKGMLFDGSGNTAGDIAFSTRNGTSDIALTERMRITYGGNVGIGSSSPSNKLVVTTSTQFDGIFLRNSTPATAARLVGTTAANDGGALILSTTSTDTVTINGNGNSWFNSANVGIGTNNPTLKLHITTATSLDGIFQTDGTRWLRTMAGTAGSGAYNNIVQSNDYAMIFSGSKASLGSAGFVIAPWDNTGVITSGLRMDASGSVGVGTASPTARVHIGSVSSTVALKINHSAASGYGYAQFGDSATATQNWHIGSEGDGSFRWYNGNWGTGTELMRINSAGNVGIGTNNPLNALHIKKTSLTDSSTNSFLLLDGQFNVGGVDSNDIIGISSRIENNSTGFQTTFNIGFSYQATGNAVLLQPSGGNVGIGTNNPAQKLVVYGSTSSSTLAAQVNNAGTGETTKARLTLSTALADWHLDSNRTNSGTFSISDGTDVRVTIDSTGNVGINTASPTAKLQVSGSGGANGTFAVVGTNNVSHFYYGAGEDTYIRGGKTSSNVHIGDVGSGLGEVYIGDTSNYHLVLNINGEGRPSSDNDLNWGANGKAWANVYSYAYPSLSDYRSKKNVQEITGSLEKVSILRPVEFEYKEPRKPGVRYGFIAHELQEVFPDLVRGEKDAVDEAGELIEQTITQDDLVPFLVDAIKELAAEVTSLKAQINDIFTTINNK